MDNRWCIGIIVLIVYCFISLNPIKMGLSLGIAVIIFFLGCIYDELYDMNVKNKKR